MTLVSVAVISNSIHSRLNSSMTKSTDASSLTFSADIGKVIASGSAAPLLSQTLVSSNALLIPSINNKNNNQEFNNMITTERSATTMYNSETATKRMEMVVSPSTSPNTTAVSLSVWELALLKLKQDQSTKTPFTFNMNGTEGTNQQKQEQTINNLHDVSSTNPPVTSCSSNIDSSPSQRQRPRSNSVGLDALALVASNVVVQQQRSKSSLINNSLSSAAVEKSDQVQERPPCRRVRSVSNPEGMEKWNSYQQDLAADGNQADNTKKPFKKRWMSTKDAAVILSMTQQLPSHVQQPTKMTGKASTSITEHQIELMQRAQSRVLEDAVSTSATLSSFCTNTNNHNTTMILPHTLAKYSDIYNQNGRVGIYTPNERAAIIAKFHEKRSRRVWNKKIRYTCRKNLADRRLRVKGRFVKRDSHCQSSNGAVSLASVDENATTTSVSTNCSTSERDVLMDTANHNHDDQDCEVVYDNPTEDQPFRRARRHTIT